MIISGPVYSRHCTNYTRDGEKANKTTSTSTEKWWNHLRWLHFTRKHPWLTHTFPEVGKDLSVCWHTHVQPGLTAGSPAHQHLHQQVNLFQNVVDLSISECLFSLSMAGLEPYMVHSQSWLDPVFPEHSAGVGPLHLPVVVGPFLLSSPLLPRPWTYPNVRPLHCQNGKNWVILNKWGRFLASTLGGSQRILFWNWEL